MTSAQPGRAECRELALKSLDRLPPFSPTLNRLLATMAKEDISFAQLADLIEKDTVLAGNVLRLVNSALYSFQGTVNSVRHAVAILGLNKLRNVALSMSISRMWTQVQTPPGWSAARFNLHSVATAVAADLLSQQVDVPYPEGGFVAGLLHDIGRLLIAISLPDAFTKLVETIQTGDTGAALEAESNTIGATHAELSGLVLAKWNLPLPIQKAGLYHHTPELAANGELHLAHLTRAADRLANDLGHSLFTHAPVPEPCRDYLAELGAVDQLPALVDQFELEFHALKSFF